MLSILIPTYNYNVSQLVKQLHEQASKTNISFEILIFDDGSKSELNTENEKLNTLSNVTFKTLAKNVGLSNNRNLLAEAAQYHYLLFIDGDSLLPHDDFIARYVNAITEDTALIYGGRIHPEKEVPERLLRWKYGIFREDTTAEERKKHKYKRMLCNNTLMSKTVFNTIGFEKTITQYGHEDTIFAYNASLLKIPVVHIQNPVLHGDVDLNAVFLNKTHKSLENLNYIYKENLIDPEFITLLSLFMKLKKFGLHYILAFIHTIGYSFFKKQLTSNNPSLFIFNIFRLSYFCHINLKR